MIVRKYQLVNKRYRDTVDLTAYEEEITGIYRLVTRNNPVCVQVEMDCYYVYGEITKGDAISAGRRLTQTRLWRYRTRYGSNSRLFECVLQEETPSDEFIL